MVNKDFYLGDAGIPKEDSFRSHAWVKTANGIPGIIALSFGVCFGTIVIIYAIVKIVDNHKNALMHFINFFHINKEEDKQDKTRPARIVVFLLLAAGLLIATVYNVTKMFDRPLVSLMLLENSIPPSILLCPPTVDGYSFNLSLTKAFYAENINSKMEGIDDVKDLTNKYDKINKSGIVCYLFKETILPIPKKDKEAFYIFNFNQSASDSMDVFIGDNKKTNWSHPFPTSSEYGNVGSLTVDSVAVIYYTETRYIELYNSHIHRSFQCSALSYPDKSTADGIMKIGIHAPKEIVTRIAEPALTLADAFSNIGGYISFCGIFSFLFREGGFVYYLSNKKKVSDDNEKGLNEQG
ncbi:11444_t:CDS:1 [Diversispora eburnea]|uniref:11444_t:CDS:1 n=1 Tax=Diversispora eburnea TaxID=1213867 RepID=A0A9N9BCV2_9GLOM|nr:11444_t:CDS:1 [Diversispora eburnea]